MEEFKDHFSKHSNVYAKYRPQYPPELFEFLSSLVEAHESAWDCATGNGQAAQGLTPHFERIIATDASKEQIANAVTHKKISYIVCTADHTPIPSHSLDMVTIAQALHWLNFPSFYTEVSRTLKRGGVIAAWGYGWMQISPDIDRFTKEFVHTIVGPYWPPERRHVDERYSCIPFPFEEIHPQEFSMEKQWDMEELIGYLETWSSSRRFFEEQHFLPTDIIRSRLHDAWSNDPSSKKTIRWPLFMRVGRVIF
jgi:ubiquinone/menaquinone biosynthesis C-methylase UbiE